MTNYVRCVFCKKRTREYPAGWCHVTIAGGTHEDTYYAGACPDCAEEKLGVHAEGERNENK